VLPATTLVELLYDEPSPLLERYWPRFLMIETRQLRSLVAVGFFLACFIGTPVCEGRPLPGIVAYFV
jgi:hypothetical protein